MSRFRRERKATDGLRRQVNTPPPPQATPPEPPHPSQPAADPPPQGVWVVSDLSVDGTYIVAIQPSPDVTVPLDADRALAYATEVTRAATYAEYDAAVLAQLRARGIPEAAAAQVLLDIRQARQPVDDVATAPLRFIPLVSDRTRAPLVHLHLGEQPLSQWTPADTRGHAMHVLDVLAGAELDQIYHRLLTDRAGLDDPVARATVYDLNNHRAEWGITR